MSTAKRCKADLADSAIGGAIVRLPFYRAAIGTD
jgi:hypothetical protein